MMKNVYFGLVSVILVALFMTCVWMAKDGLDGGIENVIVGYFGAFGCLYLALRGIEWIVEDQAREKRSQER